jgi:hypothetical protein
MIMRPRPQKSPAVAARNENQEAAGSSASLEMACQTQLAARIGHAEELAIGVIV